MHSRHLNEQMVRVLRTIGYDVGFCQGQGQYLYDRAGSRYLDLLSGFGVFAIGRNHPALRDALKSVLDADLPNLVQLDVRRSPASWRNGCWRTRPISKRCSSPTPAPRPSRLRSSSRARATGRQGIVYCDHAFHGLTYGALSLNGDDDVPRRLRAAVAGLRQRAVQRSRRAGAGAVVAQRRGLHRRADPGQGREPASRRLSEVRRRALPPARDAVRRRRNPDRARPHRPLPRRRALGRRAGHGAAREGACPADKCRSAPC